MLKESACLKIRDVKKTSSMFEILKNVENILKAEIRCGAVIMKRKNI